MRGMELTRQHDVFFFQGPYFHACAGDQGQSIFEYSCPADRQIGVQQLLQDLGRCAKSF